MSKFQVLITDRFSAESVAWLQSHSEITCSRSNSFVPTAEELHRADGLIIRSRTIIDQDLLGKAPHLKVIVTATSGFDHIDFAHTRERQVCVMHTPESNAQSAAEHTMLLVLACARKLVPAHKATVSGQWRTPQLTGLELQDKTYGVVGLGRVGSRVAQMAQAFGMRVIGCDPFAKDEEFSRLKVPRVGFEELLRMSDVVSFHVPKTKQTYHLLNRTTLEILNADAIVVNTSRGSVFEEHDLIEALRQKQIGAVGLDVFASEPLAKDSALAKFSNVVLTPHVGATTVEAFRKASDQAARQVVDFLLHHKISNELPPTNAWWLQSRDL